MSTVDFKKQDTPEVFHQTLTFHQIKNLPEITQAYIVDQYRQPIANAEFGKIQARLEEFFQKVGINSAAVNWSNFGFDFEHNAFQAPDSKISVNLTKIIDYYFESMNPENLQALKNTFEAKLTSRKIKFEGSSLIDTIRTNKKIQDKIIFEMDFGGRIDYSTQNPIVVKSNNPPAISYNNISVTDFNDQYEQKQVDEFVNIAMDIVIVNVVSDCARFVQEITSNDFIYSQLMNDLFTENGISHKAINFPIPQELVDAYQKQLAESTQEIVDKNSTKENNN